MDNEKLTGSMVPVHPDFKEDPIQKQGQIGVMTYPRELNEMYVSFPGGSEGVSSWDTLFKLKDKLEIFNELKNTGFLMAENNYKTRYKILLLLDKEPTAGVISALEIARDHPAVWERALAPIRQIERLDAIKSNSR
jgi:hypothetical protein